MNNIKSLENITNGFRAAHKINSMRSNLVHSSEASSVRQASPNILTDFLKIIADYSPEKYRSNLSTSLDRTSLYSETYRNMKQHINEVHTRKITDRDLLGFIQIIEPTLSGRTHHSVDKILKIFEIIYS